jgi:hypothetical protein
MTAAQDAIGDDMAAATARAKVADAGRKMARYKVAIDAGGVLEEISAWISDAKAQRLAAEAELRRATTRSRMTRQQVADLNAPANAAHRWRIVRISPAPGTLVSDGTALTLHLKLAHPPAAPAAPSPPAASAPAASPAGCYPLSDEGTCYQPGEYCRDSDQGMTGVAGDGGSIICEDNDGLRWEPTG